MILKGELYINCFFPLNTSTENVPLKTFNTHKSNFGLMFIIFQHCSPQLKFFFIIING